MKLVLAISTFNRIEYLQSCLSSFLRTRDVAHAWTIIIADDGSTDGTIEYINELEVDQTDIIIIKNSRSGIHQQVNSIIKKLENIPFDVCFKIDDDIEFLKKGWDLLYIDAINKSGFDHFVFCDTNWCKEQQLDSTLIQENLVGRTSLMNTHGFFYTITPNMIEKLGYFDVDNFGFRGMGHVDYTMRAGRIGSTSKETPWDVSSSNDYISASKKDYISAVSNIKNEVYDKFNRARKESLIKKERTYIPYQEYKPNLQHEFAKTVNNNLEQALKESYTENKKLKDWCKKEISNYNKWHLSKYEHFPNWFLTIGNKLFKK